MRHPRDVLGVSSMASKNEIEKRYKSLMRRYHPDKLLQNFPDEARRAEAKKRGEEILWAYNLLSHSEKLMKFEESCQSVKQVNLSHGIEYLRYDEHGKPIGPIPRKSDCYRKQYDRKVEKFRQGLPGSANVSSIVQTHLVDKTHHQFQHDGKFFDSVYAYLQSRASDAIATEDAAALPPLENEYNCILNVMTLFFEGKYYGSALEILQSDVASLLDGDIDLRVCDLVNAFSFIIRGKAIDPIPHYEALNVLYSTLYSAIESEQKAALALMANRNFAQFVRAVQDTYFQTQSPQHMSMEWLSQMQSQKPAYLLDQRIESQTYARLEREFSDAFKVNDEAKTDAQRTEMIMEQACKQVDVSEVKFERQSDNDIADAEYDISEDFSVFKPMRSARQVRDRIYTPSKSKGNAAHLHTGKANHFLMSAIAFQANAAMAQDQAHVAAGEAVALDLYRSAISEARKNSPLTRLYVYAQVLSGVLAFKFQGEMIEQFIETISKEFNLARQFVPFISMPTLHNDMDKFQVMDEKWLYGILDHISTDTTYSIEERVEAAYLLFDGAYSGIFSDDQFDTLRLRSIETFLEWKGMTMADMTQYLHPANSVLKRSPTGLINPTDELNIPDVEGGKIISDILGFEMNTQTGELSFQLVFWEEGMPRALRLMTELEFYDMLQYNLPDLEEAHFTLDPPHDLFPHLPLQEAISNLPDIPLRQTFLDVDYAALKFFATSAVSGVAPYGYHDTAEMIAHLPPHLIQVLLTKQNNVGEYLFESEGNARYWYELGEVERYLGTDNAKLICQIGKTPLVVRHHKMKIDDAGHLVDDKTPDDFDVSIARAVKSSHEVEKLIEHVVDDDYKKLLEEQLEELQEQEALHQALLQKFRDIKARVDHDDTIPVQQKKQAFDALAADAMHEFLAVNQAYEAIQSKLRVQLRTALDLNKLFAELVTKHIDEIAQYIPIINRMRLFAKINLIKKTADEIRQTHGGNAKMMQQLDMLKINQVSPPPLDAEKKIYVPAAIHRYPPKHKKNGIVAIHKAFGGVRYHLILRDVINKISSETKSEVLKPFQFITTFDRSSYKADRIAEARLKLNTNSHKMTLNDKFSAQQEIWFREQDLRHTQMQESLHNHTPFHPMTAFDFASSNISDFEFSTTVNPPVDPGFVPSAVSFTPSAAMPVPTATVSVPPVSFPAEVPATSAVVQPPVVQAPKNPMPPEQPTFFFPPTFDSDPYAQKRVESYSSSAVDWRTHLPAYQAAGNVLLQPEGSVLGVMFDEQRVEANTYTADHEKTSAPVHNKFVPKLDAGAAFLDPISRMVLPQHFSAFAATVVAMAHMPESHTSLAVPDFQLAKEVVRQGKALYQKANAYLTGHKKEDPTILTPGIFPKTEQAFRNSIDPDAETASLEDLNIPVCPPDHHPDKFSDGGPFSLQVCTARQPADLAGFPAELAETALFVVNDQKELRLHPYISGSEKIDNPDEGDAKTWYFNPDTQQIESVLTMGVANFTRDGDVFSVDSLRVQPPFSNDEAAQSTLSDIFQQQGFNDVSELFSKDAKRVHITGRFGSKELQQTFIARYLQSLNNTRTPWEELSLMRNALGDGVDRGLSNAWHCIKNFEQCIIMPAVNLFRDAALLSHPIPPGANPYAALPGFTSGLSEHQIAELYTLYDPDAYDQEYASAADRMLERGEHLALLPINFFMGTASEQLEIGSEAIVTHAALHLAGKGVGMTLSVGARPINAAITRRHAAYQLRGMLEQLESAATMQSAIEEIKAAIADIKMVRSSRYNALFGLSEAPPIFPLIEEVTIQPGTRLLPDLFIHKSADDVLTHMSFWKKNVMDAIYVMLPDGSARYLPRVFDKRSPILRRFGDPIHPMAADCYPVVSAGEVTFERVWNPEKGQYDLNILFDRTKSGNYQAYGRHLKKMNAHVHKRHGVNQVGAFEEYLDKHTDPIVYQLRKQQQLFEALVEQLDYAGRLQNKTQIMRRIIRLKKPENSRGSYKAIGLFREQTDLPARVKLMYDLQLESTPKLYDITPEAASKAQFFIPVAPELVVRTPAEILVNLDRRHFIRQADGSSLINTTFVVTEDGLSMAPKYSFCDFNHPIHQPQLVPKKYNNKVLAAGVAHIEMPLAGPSSFESGMPKLVLIVPESEFYPSHVFKVDPNIRKIVTDAFNKNGWDANNKFLNIDIKPKMSDLSEKVPAHEMLTFAEKYGIPHKPTVFKPNVLGQSDRFLWENRKIPSEFVASTPDSVLSKLEAQFKPSLVGTTKKLTVNFVITKKPELYIAPDFINYTIPKQKGTRIFPEETDMLRERVRSIHPQLVPIGENGEVIAAGEAYLEIVDGKVRVTGVTDQTGHYTSKLFNNHPDRSAIIKHIWEKYGWGKDVEFFYYHHPGDPVPPTGTGFNR